jgi:hypothetical protein
MNLTVSSAKTGDASVAAVMTAAAMLLLNRRNKASMCDLPITVLVVFDQG